MSAGDDKLEIRTEVHYNNSLGNWTLIASSSILIYDCSTTNPNSRCASCLNHAEWQCFWNLKEQKCVDENPKDTGELKPDKCPTILPNTERVEARVENWKSSYAAVVDKNIFSSVGQNFYFGAKFRFFSTLSNWMFQFLVNISIVSPNFYFCNKFSILGQNFDLVPNFDVLSHFQFLVKISIFYKKFYF